MKRSFISCMASLLVGLTASAQSYPLAKVHAFTQATLASVNPNIALEGNKEIKSDPTSKFSYYVYAECRNGQHPIFMTIWIKGRAYGIKTENVEKLPVVLDPSGMGTGGRPTTLVPVTGNKVVQLFPSGTVKQGKSSAWLDDLVKGSELVIKYSWKGRTWYYAMAKINWLDPIGGV